VLGCQLAAGLGRSQVIEPSPLKADLSHSRAIASAAASIIT
jgi:hypothetical protein